MVRADDRADQPGDEPGDEAGTIRVELVYAAAPHDVDLSELRLARGATAADALQASGLVPRRKLDAASVDLGVWGEVCARERPLRAIALTDEASGRTLAARLLPLMGNEQRDVAGATLVYRVGGFSVFELAAARSP